MDHQPLLVDDDQASRLLGISRSKFHLLVAEGRIRRVKIGRAARYRPADLVKYIEDTAGVENQPGNDSGG